MTTVANTDHCSEASRSCGRLPHALSPRTILVGLDGSSWSWKATEQAILWARITGAELVGVAVVDQPSICRPEPVPIGGTVWKRQRDASRLADAHRQVRGFLTAFADRCAEAGVTGHPRACLGEPAEVVLRVGRGCDLVVLGQQTSFHFETQQAPDDTLRRVLRRSSCPVLVIPETVGGGSEALVAFDGRPQALHALEALVRLRAGGLASVRVVSIDPDVINAKARAEPAARLWGDGQAAVADGLPSTGDPVKLILEQMAGPEVGLLVMGISRRSPLREFFAGSVTRKILAEAHVPLLLSN